MSVPAVLDTEERFALIFSDNSINLCERNETLEEAIELARTDDPNEKDPQHFIRVVRVRLSIVEDYGKPLLQQFDIKCPKCGRSNAKPSP